MSGKTEIQKRPAFSGILPPTISMVVVIQTRTIVDRASIRYRVAVHVSPTDRSDTVIVESESDDPWAALQSAMPEAFNQFANSHFGKDK